MGLFKISTPNVSSCHANLRELWQPDAGGIASEHGLGATIGGADHGGFARVPSPARIREMTDEAHTDHIRLRLTRGAAEIEDTERWQ